MDSTIEFQGGNTNVARQYFTKAIEYIEKYANGNDILDLGCGVEFIFEQYCEEQGKEYRFTCVDINSSEKDLKYIENKIVFDITEEMNLNKKFDAVACFEVIEHVDKTEMLLHNAYNMLKKEGIILIAFPNLASFYSRIELLLGNQPHCLEVSNIADGANIGMGRMGYMNNSDGIPLHHIRGITYRAGKELLERCGFEVLDSQGYINGGLLKYLGRSSTSLGSVVIICAKKGQIEVMGPIKHLMCSSFLALGVYLKDKDVVAATSTVISGVLVDLDHIYEYVDYIAYEKKRGNDITVSFDNWHEHFELFGSGEYFNEKGTVKVVFHSWELAGLAVLLCLFSKRKNSIVYGFTLGYILHLCLDQIGNNVNRLGYFWLYRWMVDWRQDEIIEETKNNNRSK